MQPLSGGDSRGILLSSRATQIGQESVNSEAFWRKKTEDVAADEVFFHKYFSQIGKAKHASRKTVSSTATPGSDDEEVENEDEIWQALVDSRPEVEGNSDDDSDMEMLDLGDSDVESSGGTDIAEGNADGPWVESEDTEALSFDGLEEEDALFGNESDVPSELDELFANELQTGQPLGSVDKDGESNGRKRRKLLKSLPTFASVDDYAEMLDNDEGEDL
jgi:ribosome biogenesis protein MAK21